MTYAEAKTEAKKRDDAWEEFRSQHSQYTIDQTQKRALEIRDLIKLEGCPFNAHRIVYKGAKMFWDPLIDENGVFFVPSFILCGLPPKEDRDYLPLSILDEDEWSVHSYHEDYDW